jgi:hypothetical protein
MTLGLFDISPRQICWTADSHCQRRNRQTTFRNQPLIQSTAVVQIGCADSFVDTIRKTEVVTRAAGDRANFTPRILRQ